MPPHWYSLPLRPREGVAQTQVRARPKSFLEMCFALLRLTSLRCSPLPGLSAARRWCLRSCHPSAYSFLTHQAWKSRVAEDLTLTLRRLARYEALLADILP